MIPQIFYQIGYSICHQIATRSFFIEEKQFPLCSRCTGIYFGISITFLFYFLFKVLKNKKPIIPPPLWVNIISIFFIFLMPLHALSTLFITTNYDNIIRFITGILFGFSLPFYLIITINYSKRFNYQKEKIISYKEYFLLSVIILLSILIFLLKINFILYLSIYLSTFGLILFVFLINLSLLITITDEIKKFQKVSIFSLITINLILSASEFVILNFLHSKIL